MTSARKLTAERERLMARWAPQSITYQSAPTADPQQARAEAQAILETLPPDPRAGEHREEMLRGFGYTRDRSA